MTDVLMLRHAATAWNAERRLQGRIDVPLSPAGRAELARWSLPSAFIGATILTSPLARARETAAQLGPARVEPRLVEMNWGAWEGQGLAQLRRADPTGMAALEAQGQDLRPPGGESPREVRDRLTTLFVELATPLAFGAGTTRFVLVTHKGVLRAALSLATGWDLASAPPLKLRDGVGWRLALDARGLPEGEIDELVIDGAPSCVS